VLRFLSLGPVPGDAPKTAEISADRRIGRPMDGALWRPGEGPATMERSPARAVAATPRRSSRRRASDAVAVRHDVLAGNGRNRPLLRRSVPSIGRSRPDVAPHPTRLIASPALPRDVEAKRRGAPHRPTPDPDGRRGVAFPVASGSGRPFAPEVTLRPQLSTSGRATLTT
jgi:hypothetical protein